MGRVFGSQIEWLIFLVNYFKDNKNWCLIIRVHPAEAIYKSNTKMGEELIKALKNTIPENIKIISSADKINTFSVVKKANIGFVFTSSIGLEMAMLGLPVVTAGCVHYAGLGFTYDPKNQEDFKNVVDNLMNNLSNISNEATISAGVYFNIYHGEVYKEAVWNWRNFEHEGLIKDWDSCYNKNSPFLDFLKR